MPEPIELNISLDSQALAEGFKLIRAIIETVPPDQHAKNWARIERNWAWVEKVLGIEAPE